MSFPLTTNASIFSILSPALYGKNTTVNTASAINSQTLQILEANRTVSPDLAYGGGDITIVGGSALMSDSGPVGTMADVADDVSNDTISTYVVRSGDTISSIAKMFGVSSNTVMWANNITGGVIHEGQVLVILPISGVEHTVKKGDTIASIAKLYKADVYDISRYNNIALDATLTVGDSIVVPDGEIASPVSNSSAPTSKLRGAGGPSYDGYYMRPIIGGHKSQGLHGYNAVDLAPDCHCIGGPIFAAADGIIIVATYSGWNGGYGNYVVIAHPNGTQTLYAHMSKNLASVGESVVRGQLIGLIGSTGKSNGPHVHFEVRGAKNPF